MANLIGRLLRGEKRRDETPGEMDRVYVSEFTRFMEHFLEEHPEVRRDQKKGLLIYWEKKVDLTALEKAAKDSVSDDGYGFYASAFKRDHKH